jgi:hypothetical protein
MREPDGTFHLSADDRAGLISHIDVDALERLLQRLMPPEREHFLKMFTNPPPNQSFELIKVIGGDPAETSMMNALLDEIWAPVWELFGPEAIEDWDDSPLPGRELARERLHAREGRE